MLSIKNVCPSEFVFDTRPYHSFGKDGLRKMIVDLHLAGNVFLSRFDITIRYFQMYVRITAVDQLIFFITVILFYSMHHLCKSVALAVVVPYFRFVYIKEIFQRRSKRLTIAQKYGHII